MVGVRRGKRQATKRRAHDERVQYHVMLYAGWRRTGRGREVRWHPSKGYRAHVGEDKVPFNGFTHEQAWERFQAGPALDECADCRGSGQAVLTCSACDRTIIQAEASAHAADDLCSKCRAEVEAERAAARGAP